MIFQDLSSHHTDLPSISVETALPNSVPAPFSLSWIIWQIHNHQVMLALQNDYSTKEAAFKQTAHPAPVGSEKDSDNLLGKSSKKKKKNLMTEEVDERFEEVTAELL